jgi:single-stranded-DNA-specific exonuclease
MPALSITSALAPANAPSPGAHAAADEAPSTPHAVAPAPTQALATPAADSPAADATPAALHSAPPRPSPPPCPDKRWTLLDHDPAALAALTTHLDIDEMTATLLLNRGLHTPDAAHRFLNPSLDHLHDPFLLPNMSAAVCRLRDALASRQRILIFGDDDVDGITSSCLVFLLLKHLGARPNLFIPQRTLHGHGFNAQSLRAALALHPCDLLITTDCGSSSYEEISWLRDQSIDTIIIDHHALPAQHPPAVALVNPQLPQNRYPFPALAAVGVAYNFALAVTRDLTALGVFERFPAPNLHDLLDLVCLGTVADVVPLRDVNRVFVRLGLLVLQRRRRPGLAALLERAFPNTALPITERTISHRIAPRLNAAGRVGDVNDCITLLTTDRYSIAQEMARRLDAYNVQRQATEAVILHQALEQARAQIDAGQPLLILYDPRWHQGVLGIVASRLLERFQRPSILIAPTTDGRVRGSARCADGFDILSLLRRCAPLLDAFGGHTAAAGLSLPTANLDALRLALLSSPHLSLNIAPALSIDAELSLRDFGLPFVQRLERLAPFGAGNREPTFLIKRLHPIRAHISHRGNLRMRLRCSLRDTFDVIGFAMGHAAPPNPLTPLDVILSPRLQESHTPSVELRMIAFRDHA